MSSRKQWILNLKVPMKRKTWSLVPRGNHKVILGTWAFHIKCKPNGSLNKFKACFCVCSNIQKKSDSSLEDEPHSPVISWSTVHLLLALMQQLQLKTVHLDFSNAFIQSDLPEGAKVHVELPQRCKAASDAVLKLHKSLCGQVKALWL